jgi:hypothetical protein
MLDFKLSLTIKIISSLFFLISGIVWKKLLVTGSINYHYIFYRVIVTLSVLLLIKFSLNFEQITSVITLNDWIICIFICLFSFWDSIFTLKLCKMVVLVLLLP